MSNTYQRDIKYFGDLYCALKDAKNQPASITPTIHILLCHVPEFCSYVNKGLGYYSTQGGEAVHHNFNKTWEQFKTLESNPNYGEKLLDAVAWYDEKHIWSQES